MRQRVIAFGVVISLAFSLLLSSSLLAKDGALNLTNASKTYVIQSFKVWYKGKYRATEIAASPITRFLKPNEKMSINFICMGNQKVGYQLGLSQTSKVSADLMIVEQEAALCDLDNFTITDEIIGQSEQQNTSKNKMEDKQ